MTARETLGNARAVFLDSAPVIYFVEANQRYLPVLQPLFRRMDEKTAMGVVTAVTLAECLVHPLRRGDQHAAAAFVELLTAGPGILFVPLDHDCGGRAADLRARHNFTLSDALQLAACAVAGCDVFLTNDMALKRAVGPQIVVLDDVLAEMQT